MELHQQQAQSANISKVTTGVSALNSFGYIVFIVVVVEFALMIGMNLYQTSRIKQYNEKITATQATLATKEHSTINKQVDEIISGQTQLEAVLASKTKWSTFYTKLNAITPQNVRISTLTINEDGSIQASGETTTLSSLAKALVVWQNGVGDKKSPFSTVKLASNGYTTGDKARLVTFSITGTINLAEFK